MRAPQIEFWVIYENPHDYPGKFVLRRWIGLEPDERPACIGEKLATVQQCIPAGCILLARSPEEDPIIIQIWI